MSVLRSDIFQTDLTPQQAVSLQRTLRSKVEIAPLSQEIRYIGGADISFNKYSETVYAGIVILNYADMTLHAHALVVSKAFFPYVPGLLSFRELPALLEAWELLDLKPEVMMVDGQGIAHPRRLGIATHFGLVTGCPSLGCAKKKLTGSFSEPDPEKGSYTPLFDKTEQIGLMVRTKNKVKPMIVSPGHLMSMDDALNIALHCARGYRLPEPTRQAHLLVNRLRLGEVKPGLYRYPRQEELWK